MPNIKHAMPSVARHLVSWRLLCLLLTVVGATLLNPVSLPAAPTDAAQHISEAYQAQRSGFMVEITGRVERVLADDSQGSRHQRFIIRLDNDMTLLVSHNIDLAPRVLLQVDDEVVIKGQYEWSRKGGVLHWTHHDPQGKHPGGWIRHHGRLYQ